MDHRLNAIRWFAAGFEQPPAIPSGVDQQIGLQLIGKVSAVQFVEVKGVVEKGLDHREPAREIRSVYGLAVELGWSTPSMILRSETRSPAAPWFSKRIRWP